MNRRYIGIMCAIATYAIGSLAMLSTATAGGRRAVVVAHATPEAAANAPGAEIAVQSRGDSAKIERGSAITIRVSVEADRVLHPVSPFIFGASGVDPATAKKYGLTTVRWGGNRSSRYNWRARADNAGSDWFFLNGKAARWDEFVSTNHKAGLQSYITVPLLPWVAKSSDGWSFSVAKYGAQQKAESYVADRGNGLRPDGSPITGNDPRDSSIASTAAFQAEGLRGLAGLAGSSSINVYGLDNEPMLWHATHRDVHPEPASYEEVFARGRDYALAIKEADPRGLIAGPCTWGWTDLQFSAADAGKDNYATHADRRAHGDLPFLAWYVAAMKRASDKAGKRLLDLVDVHIYPQGQADGQGVYGGQSKSAAMRALRLRSTRGLWDPSYRDESWIREPVMLIPRIRKWVDAHDPGLKICIGEYSWGGDDDASGAVAQAEILGILARENVDHAYFWAGLAGVQRFAFALYRNPDGSGHGFGDKFLACKSDQPDLLSVYAARRSDGAVTVVLVNKDLDRTAQAHVAIGTGGKSANGGAAAGTLFRLTNPPGPIKRELLKADANGVVVAVPPLTAAMYVTSR
jgi:Glycoside hydrolase family 44